MNRWLAGSVLMIGLAGWCAAQTLRPEMAPEAWQGRPLETAGTANGWYFLPDFSGNPQVMVKANGVGANSARKILSGGPPDWSGNTAANLQLVNGQGVLARAAGGGGILVAPHGTARMGAALIDAGGVATSETIDPNAGTYTGVSAEYDNTGKLHVGYIWNGNTICYARRNGPNNWNFTSQTIPGLVIHQTAVVPGGFTDVKLYFTATTGGVTLLYRTLPGVAPDGLLRILWAANPLFEVDRFVSPSLRGSRFGQQKRLYYFEGFNSTTWRFKRIIDIDLLPVVIDANAGNVNPRAIQVATGPDNIQRAAWYNPNQQRVHYYAPTNPGSVTLVLTGFPVSFGGAAADLDGFHFGPDGMPYLLYRSALNQGFIAFPNDEFDFNGNGRPDLLDNAFGSPHAGLEVLPVGPAAESLPASAGRFNIRFPTVGTPVFNGLDGVVSLASNLLYSVRYSPDGEQWNPATGNDSFHQTAPGIWTVVSAQAAPGSLPKRFARLVVTRPAYRY